MSISIKNASIKYKFLMFFIPIALIFLVVVTIAFYYISINQIKYSEIILLKSRTDEFKDLMHSQEKNSLHLVTFIANMEGVIAAYSEPDNEVGFQKLQAAIKPTLNQLNVDIKKFQLHFHKPPAISFWRIFTKKRNDDLSKFRKTIVKTYETKQPVIGLEHGVFNFGLRSISPIFDAQKKYIGSVEMITDMPEILSILNAKKEDTVLYLTVVNTEYLLKFVSKEYMEKSYPTTVGNYKASQCIDTKFNVSDIITQERIERILDTEQPEYELIGNYVVGFMPIIDFDQNKPGLFVFSTDISENISKTKDRIWLITIGIIIAFAIIISGIIVIINKIIVNPIGNARQRIIDLSEGKF